MPSRTFPRILVSCLAGFVLLLPLGGCGTSLTDPNDPNGTLTEPGDPPIGTRVEAKSILDLYPQLLAGMKYVYLVVDKNGEVSKSTRVEAEVLSSDADKAKVRLIVAGNQSGVIDIDRARPPILPPGGLTFEGRERITIPAGSFSAQKYSYSQGTSTFNVWAQPNVGVLMTVEQKGFAHVVTNTLQSYQGS